MQAKSELVVGRKRSDDTATGSTQSWDPELFPGWTGQRLWFAIVGTFGLDLEV